MTYCCDHLRDLKIALDPALEALIEAVHAADAELANAGAAYQARDNAIQNQRRCRRIREHLDAIFGELPPR
jgi:hypothetical protein